MNYISLTENHLFSKAYSSRQRAVTKTLALYVLKDKHEKRLKKENPLKESVNRVGISASKKIGGAVERNRAKRVIREAYRHIDSEHGIKRGFIIVIAARERSTVLKMQDVMRDLQYALTKLDMLSDTVSAEETCGCDEKSGEPAECGTSEADSDV